MNIRILLIFSLILCTVFSLDAQKAGSILHNQVILPAKAKIGIFGNHSFKYFGDERSVISTYRGTTSRSEVFFAEGSHWHHGSENGFVDGFVSTANTNFVFPIGHKGVFAPVALDNAVNTTAGFFYVDPIVFSNSNSIDAKIDRIVSKGFWKISGENVSRITLGWNELIDIDDSTDGQLNLSIIGHKNGEWVVIPSKVNEHKLDMTTDVLEESNEKSNLHKGSISSLDGIDLSEYDGFSIATLSTVSGFVSLEAFPNPAVSGGDISVKYQIDKVTDFTELVVVNTTNTVVDKISLNSKSDVFKLDLNQYSTGTYWLVLKDRAGFKKHQKIVVVDAVLKK